MYEQNMAVECGGFQFEVGIFKGKFVCQIRQNKTKLSQILMTKAKLPDLKTQKTKAFAMAFSNFGAVRRICASLSLPHKA